MIQPARWGEYRYFRKSEFVCACCGAENMDHMFLLTLDALRESYGRPIHVSSGYRCPDHNSSVSSTGRNGPHTTGLAVDIAVDREKAHSLLHVACQMDLFRGIGLNQKGIKRFIHLDTCANNRPTIWTY